MIVLDANVFIYAAKQQIDLEDFIYKDVAYASVTVIETLGYRYITVAEQNALNNILSAHHQLELSESIIRLAVSLRQAKKMSLGDSIVAATALEYDCQLWTANTEDFAHIADLKLHNPLEKK